MAVDPILKRMAELKSMSIPISAEMKYISQYMVDNCFSMINGKEKAQERLDFLHSQLKEIVDQITNLSESLDTETSREYHYILFGVYPEEWQRNLETEWEEVWY